MNLNTKLKIRDILQDMDQLNVDLQYDIAHLYKPGDFIDDEFAINLNNNIIYCAELMEVQDEITHNLYNRGLITLPDRLKRERDNFEWSKNIMHCHITY